jgi:hypothetical protein
MPIIDDSRCVLHRLPLLIEAIATATQPYKSMELRDTAASTKYSVANPHQGKFRAEVSRYLGNSYYTGRGCQQG